MKTTNKFIAVSAIVMATGILLAGCQREAISPEGQDAAPEEVIIPVSFESAQATTDTKITVDPTTGVTAWDTNEPIGVYVSGSGANAYVKAPVVSNSIRLSLTSVQSRANYAIAPWSCAPASGYTTPTVTYPSTYDMDGKVVTSANTWAPTPMVAKNTTTDLKFYHVGGLLRLHITDIPASTNQLVITFTGKKVTGTFDVTNNPGTSTAVATSTSATSTSVTFTNLTITGAEAYLNIPIPAGNYNTLTGITIDASGGTALSVTKSIPAGSWGTIGHGNGKKMEVSFVSVTHSSGYDGKFRDKEISKGYLIWESDKYAFSDPDDPLLPIRYYGGDGAAAQNIIYHQWGGTGATNSLKARLDGDPAEDANITNDVIIDGLAWRVPLNSEWTSLFGDGTSCSINGETGSYSVVRINLAGATSVGGYNYSTKGLNNAGGGAVDANNGGYQVGMLLVPDRTAVICPGITAKNKSYTSGTTLSWSSLKVLLDGGCVFLPVVGLYNGSSWFGGGVYGLYWSSVKKATDQSYYLFFNGSNPEYSENSKVYSTPIRLFR